MKQRDESGLVKGASSRANRPRANRRRRTRPPSSETETDHRETQFWVMDSNQSDPGPTVSPEPEKRRQYLDDQLTQVFRPGGGVSAEADAMKDPPAGWLVIVDGPGKGRAVEVGYGFNWIGRDRTERVTLDYGDAAISRNQHVAVVYDAASRKFHIQHGGGVNLSYVNDQPVLAPAELKPFSHIRIGKTTLRFVPLCGPDFSWEEHATRD